MNSVMTTLQQPLSMAALAHCLGWRPRKAAVAGPRRGRRHRDRSRLGGAQPVALDGPAGEDDPAAQGCGWFDSSHELNQGLEVLEHAGAEGLGGDLPVTIWLGLVMAGVPAAEPGGDHFRDPQGGAQGMMQP